MNFLLYVFAIYVICSVKNKLFKVLSQEHSATQMYIILEHVRYVAREEQDVVHSKPSNKLYDDY